MFDPEMDQWGVGELEVFDVVFFEQRSGVVGRLPGHDHSGSGFGLKGHTTGHGGVSGDADAKILRDHKLRGGICEKTSAGLIPDSRRARSERASWRLARRSP